jgi:ATP-dependent RNA helicase DHX37/DHR1
MASYEVQWISKASASQRAGRAGRTGPGHCYRLYSGAAYGKDDLFPEFSEPEIKKMPVEGIVLMLKFMTINKVMHLKAIYLFLIIFFHVLPFVLFFMQI